MKIYRFGPFTLHSGRYQLSRAGYPIPLARVPMEILLLLLASGGHLLTRAEIASAVWPEAAADEVEQSINSAVNKLRSVLRDSSSRPKYIQTVIGKGYRFVANVTTEELADERLPQAEAQAQSRIQAEPGAAPAPEPPAYPLPSSAADPGPADPEGVEPRLATRRRGWWIAASVLLLAGLSMAALHTRRPQSSPGRRQYMLTRLTNNDGEDGVTAVGLSPDGTRIVYADADGVELQTIGSAAIRLLRAPAMQEIDRLEWTDANQVLMSGLAPRPEVWQLSLGGEPPVLFRADARQAVPNPQSGQVAFTTAADSEVWVADRHGERARRVVAGHLGVTYPLVLWSRNGKTLLLERHSRVEQLPVAGDAGGPGFHPAYVAVDAASGRITAERDEMFFTAAALRKNGELLMTQSGGYPVMAGTRTLSVAVDPETGAFRSDPSVVTELGEAGLTEMSSAAQADAIAVVRAQDLLPRIYVGNFRSQPPALEDVHLLTFDRNEDYTHGWLRDSSAVLFESRRNGRFQIFKQSSNRHDADALTRTAGHETYARATPDGKWILFAARKVIANGAADEDPFQLYRIPAAGGVPVQVPTGGTDAQFRCALTADLCLLRDRDSFGQIVYYRLDPITGRGAELYRTPAVSGDLGDWDLSPDGTQLAFLLPSASGAVIETVRSGPGGMYAGVKHLSVATSGTLTDLNWAADGRSWIVGDKTNVGTNLLFVDKAGRATLLRHTRGESWGTPSPDGRQLAFVDHVADSNAWLLRK